jgi:undecaprenyl pyrophosphate phosphatase UppP
MGLERAAAARFFSFLLGIPFDYTGGVSELKESRSTLDLAAYRHGFTADRSSLSAAFFSYLSRSMVTQVLQTHNTARLFIWYRLALSALFSERDRDRRIIKLIDN